MSTRKIFTNLDLRFNELLNAKLAPLTNESEVGTIGTGDNGKIALMTTDGISEYVDGSGLAMALMSVNGRIDTALAEAAAALDRQNHTGTQTASTISDFVVAAKAAAQELTLDQLAAPAGDIDFGGHAIVGVAMPEGAAAAAGDVATRSFVEAMVSNGSAAGADKLTTARDFSIAGVITAPAVSFDGTANVELQASIADGALSLAKTEGLVGILDGKLNTSTRGAVDGVAPLGSDGLVPAAYLPGYVDDVLEFADFASLPAPGEREKIYVTLDNGNIYRWSGTAYVRINDAVSRSEEALQLAEAQDFSLSGVITATAVQFDGTGPVELVTNIEDGALSTAKVAGLDAALDAKFDKAGGIMQGVASYAAGVTPAAAQDLVTKGYVDTAIEAVDSAIQNATMIGSDSIDVNAEKEISVILKQGGHLAVDESGLSVDVAGIYSNAKGVTGAMADSNGVVAHSENMGAWLEARGLEDMPYAADVAIYDAAGQKVEMAIQWTGTSLNISGQGADPDEMFTIVLRA